MNNKENPTASSILCQSSNMGLPGEGPEEWSFQLGHLAMIWRGFLAGPLPPQTKWHTALTQQVPQQSEMNVQTVRKGHSR
jgi:hypothetical protein